MRCFNAQTEKIIRYGKCICLEWLDHLIISTVADRIAGPLGLLGCRLAVALHRSPPGAPRGPRSPRGAPGACNAARERGREPPAPGGLGWMSEVLTAVACTGKSEPMRA